MEAFLGTWKIESNGDFHKFMNHFGVPTAIAKMVLQFGSKTTFSQKDADTYCTSISSVRGKTEATFRLGQEFEEESSGNTHMKVNVGTLFMHHVLFYFTLMKCRHILFIEIVIYRLFKFSSLFKD